MTPRGWLNVECIFGLAFALWMLCRSVGAAKSKARPGAGDRYWLAAILAFTAICFGWALPFPFLSDEYVLLGHARDFRLGYNFTHGGGDGFFRPLGHMSIALELLWAGASPVLWHLSGLTLHLGICAMLYAVARRLYPDSTVALWATAFFALHGSHPEPVSYMAARFDLLASFFVMAGLLLFMKFLERPRAAPMAGALLCLLGGLLSKESAYVFPLLATVVVFWWGKRDQWRTTLPFWILTAAMFAYRWALLGGIGGYRDRVSGAPEILRLTPLHAIQGLGLRLWGVLTFPVNWSVPPEPYLAVALAAAALAMLWLAMTRIATSDWLLPVGFLLISALPVIHMLLIGPDLMSSSHIYLPSIGFALFLAVIVERSRFSRGGLLAGATLLIFQVAALEHNLTIWGDVARLAKRTCESAAADGSTAPDLPAVIRGVHFFRNGFAQCVEMKRREGR